MTLFSRTNVQGGDREERRWIPPVVWTVAAISLVVKLTLIRLNGGEYTDGIIQLQLWNSPVVFFPPGYGLASRVLGFLTGDPAMAGRLVSILASAAVLPVFYRLAFQVLKDERASVWAVLFLALSPIFNRWSLRVMTDSLFLLLFVTCCHQFFAILQDPKRSPVRLLAWAGLASLVRYQGFFFVPLTIYLIGTRQTFAMGDSSFRRIGKIVLAFIPWFLLSLWIALRGFGHTQQFIERGSYGFWITLQAYYALFEAFVLYWPWATTFGLTILACAGMLGMSRGTMEEKRFLAFFGVTAVVFLIVQSCFLSFQFRYLLPLVPLWCLAGGKGWRMLCERVEGRELRGVLLSLVVLNLAVMSAAVLYFQRAAFSDLAESARFIGSPKYQRVTDPEAKVLSDDVYRDGIYNVKMNFWANGLDGTDRPILPYRLNFKRQAKAGDVVILHNTYSDLEAEKEWLEERFDLKVLQTWRSASLGGDYVTLPLLPDIMVEPRKPPLTSNPPCMGFRFIPQYYYSVALLLNEKSNQ